MQLNATSPIKMPRPYGGEPPIICAKPIDSVGHYEITIQLCGVIEKTSQFIEVFEVLSNAQQGDEVRIVIDTPGGNVFATQLLVDYMTRCKANVTTVASGLVASAGTIVWFYGKQREVGPWAKFMFHGTSHGAFGRTSEIKEEAEQLVKFMETLLKDMVAAGIITTEEYEKITSCKQDTYITGEAMRKRLVAAINATESFNILKSQEGDDDAGSDSDDEGKGSGEKADPDKGSGSGEKTEGDPAAPEDKKSEGEDGEPDKGSGSGKEGDEPAKEPDADPDKGSGSGKKEGEPDEGAAPTDKKNQEGEEGDKEPEKKPEEGDDDDKGEGESGAGEKEHGDDCDCDDCKSKKAKKNQGGDGEPGEGDGDPAGDPDTEGEPEDSWCADSYV